MRWPTGFPVRGARTARLLVCGAALPHEGDLPPLLLDAIDLKYAVIHSGGFCGYVPLKQAGIPHEHHIEGNDRARSIEIIPWSHAIFSNQKACPQRTKQRDRSAGSVVG
jgi:hypothetical protein